MNFRIKFSLLAPLPSLIAIALLLSTSTTGASSTSIVALVNDEPITSYNVNERIKLLTSDSPQFRKALQKKFTEKRSKNMWVKIQQDYRPQSKAEAMKLMNGLRKTLRREVLASFRGKLKKNSLDELIEERIKFQAATKLGVSLTDEDLDTQLERTAARNKNPKNGKPMTKAQFLKILSLKGVPIDEYRVRIKAKLSWIRVIQRKFQYQVNIGDQAIDRLINNDTGDKAPVKTVFKMQRVRLSLKSTASESVKARRFIRAEKLRKAVTSCKQLKNAVARINGASLKALGTKSAETFPHTMRIYLNHTKDGHLTPPTLTSSGVELYAVCQRKQRRVADKKKRKAVKAKLRSQEYQILARRHLQDLKQEALIEYR